MFRSEYLIAPLLRRFIWFDEGLHNYLRHKGWPAVTRSQAMVVMAALLGVTRPADIARMLGVSRQAIHATIYNMVEAGLLDLADDPDDRRSKIVLVLETGLRLGEHASEAGALMNAELARRIGDERIAALLEALAIDWGAPIDRF
jgi:DNA-binding MarR family transcriptional regulator